MKIVIIFVIAFLCYCIWQYQELKKFQINEYSISSDKVKQKMNLVMISDMHSHIYGDGNDILYEAVKKQQPDLILIPGDMIISKKTDRYETAYQAFVEFSRIAPVYFCNGNHESRPAHRSLSYTEEFFSYEKKVKKAGIHILNNQKESVDVRGNKINIYGAEIDLKYYTKGKCIPLPENYLKEHLGEAEEGYNILLAHNPAYTKQYADWGADLTFCGHNHGGLVRIPGIGSLISPQFQLFPKYDAGRFSFGKREVIIGRGLGTHTFHIRIFNRAELVVVHVLPEMEK